MNNRREEKMGQWVKWVGDMGAVTTFLLGKSWTSPWVIPKTLNSFFRAIGIVAFANNPISGVLILAALFVGNPDVAWACLVAGVIAVVFSKILNQPEALISDGVTVFNNLLVGCISVAVFPSITGYQLDAKFWGILIVGLILTSYIDKGLNSIMAPCKLPALSIPFNVAAAIMLLGMRGGVGLTGIQLPQDLAPNSTGHDIHPAGNTTEAEVEVDWLKVMEGTLLAAGQIYGVGTVDSSILVYLGFLFFSPILVLFFYMGSVIGTVGGVYLSTAPYTAVYQGLWGYNSLLTSGAISYFLVLTPSSVLAAIVGATLATFVQAASDHIFFTMTVPVLSYPFNVATLLILAIATSENPPLILVPAKTFPEHQLFLHILARRSRHGGVRASEQDPEQPLQVTHKT